MYIPLEIQKYVNSTLEYHHDGKINNLKEYYNVAEILSEIYPLLKEEI